MKNQNENENENENIEKSEIFKSNSDTLNSIKNWEKVQFENLESHLSRVCQEIYFCDRAFNLGLTLDNFENTEIGRNNINFSIDNDNDHSTGEYDRDFNVKYTEVAAHNVMCRLSSCLSALLYLDENVGGGGGGVGGGVVGMTGVTPGGGRNEREGEREKNRGREDKKEME